jgi:hypothetical protein
MRGALTGMCALAAVALGLVGAPSRADAQLVTAPLSAPSDQRADFVPGNVVTCAGAGILGAPGVNIIQVGALQNNSAADPFVSGAVSPHQGGGEELNVTILGANVFIDAVVVKGGNGYNIYSNPAVLPPALASPQRYISPLVGTGGNVPQISHWFICYHVTLPIATGSLQVLKLVQAPDGVPVTPLPTSFTALVNCNDGILAHQNVTFSFGRGGGRSSNPDLVGIPNGTVCTVVEQPPGGGAVVIYTPPGANTSGVTITTPGAGVVVTIINDFSNVPVQRGTIHLEKILVPGPPGVVPPPTFTVEVACDDGTRELVTLPGTGGAGTPDISVRSLSFCALVEDVTSLPAGWTLTYSLNGGQASTTPPVVPVPDSSTQTVTITNNATAVEPTTTIAGTTPTTAAPTTATGGTGVLPPTGARGSTSIVAVLLVISGLTVVLLTRRLARRS